MNSCNCIKLNQWIYNFLAQLEESQISAILNGDIKLRLENKRKETKPAEDILDITQKLESFKTREEAAAYFNESSFKLSILKTIAKHYSIPNQARLKKDELIEKLIETTVGSRLRFEAIYNTKVR